MGEFYCCHTHATALTPSYSFWTALPPANSQMVSDKKVQQLLLWEEPSGYLQCAQITRLGGAWLLAFVPLGLAQPGQWPPQSIMASFSNWAGPSYLQLDWKTNHVWLAASLMKERIGMIRKPSDFSSLQSCFMSLWQKRSSGVIKRPMYTAQL